MQRVSVHERRLRLARRHRLAPETLAADVGSATSAMVALHATDPVTVYLSAWARTRRMTVADLEEALYSRRALVKHLAMRRTLFIFPQADLDVVQSAVSAHIAASESRRLVREVERAGLYDDGAAWLEDASRAVLGTLADGRVMSWTELREELPVLGGRIAFGADRKWGGEYPVGPRVLTVLSAGGQIVRATNVGGWTASRALGEHARVAGPRPRAARGAGCGRRPGATVAAGVRPGHRAGPAVVARPARGSGQDCAA